MFDFWTARRVRKKSVSKIYGVMVNQARTPAFYSVLAVPDTPDGRFDLILLHSFLVHNRIKEEQGAGQYAQALFDYMFREFDKALREMGVGDLSVPKQMKYMMKSYNGRLHRYSEGILSKEDADLKDALRRNIYRKVENVTDDQLTALENYVTENISALAAQGWSAIKGGDITFKELAI